MTKPVWSHLLDSSALPTIPDCIRYIIGVSYHRQTFMLHINTLVCVKAEIYPMLRNSHFSYIVQNHSGVVMFTYSIYKYLKNTTA